MTLPLAAGRRTLVVILLALCGAAVSGLLLLQHHGETLAVSAVDQVCGDGASSGCDAVNQSPYSEIGGIPLAAVGLVFYLSLALLLALGTIASPEVGGAGLALALPALGLALLADLGLLGVQAIAIDAYCKLCIFTYLLNIGGFLILLPVQRPAGSLRQALGRSEGRLVLAGWVAGTLAFAVAAGAADLALASRQRGRDASLLGAPAPATVVPSPGVAAQPEANPPAARPSAAMVKTPPEGAASDPERAKRAEQEVQRLQGILDDPRKLEQYLADKAAREFDQAKVQDVDLKHTPFKGPATAPVRVVEYSDFLCPFCRNIAGAFAGYVPQSGNRVALYFKNYPLDKACNPNLERTVHEGACWLALGAVCAQEQGRFWPYHDKVFGTNLKDPKREDVARLAGEAGLDRAAFASCLDSPGTNQRLAFEIKEGYGAGVRGTPTVFVNGKQLPRINDFLLAVEKEARRLGLPPAPPPAQGQTH